MATYALPSAAPVASASSIPAHLRRQRHLAEEFPPQQIQSHDNEQAQRQAYKERQRRQQHDPHPQEQAPVPPPKPEGAPVLKKKAKKPPLPNPPETFVDDRPGKGFEFTRIGFLGEGGFARVYEVVDQYDEHHAVKVVAKESLQSTKSRTKMFAEIKLHKALQHPNIVEFEDCFEDNEHIYMTMALCENGNLNDLLRRRRRYTEPETRFFLLQILGACHYMHSHQVIHRDLKLGNIFLDHHMNVKVGDFGLAALIETPGDRKKTICGTPNYIAPEVLFDTANGHSFEVDIWSIGVILYTLLIGRPPFQTADVDAIYDRIKNNTYEFPTNREISSEAQDLISEILTPDPSQRPSLHQIVDHPFFYTVPFPPSIPITAHERPPSFVHVSPSQSKNNFETLRRIVLLDDAETEIRVDVLEPPEPTAGPGSSIANIRYGTSVQKKQEREFQKAVQPSSPISALLKSARQPLLIARSSPLRKSSNAENYNFAGRAGSVRGASGSGTSSAVPFRRLASASNPALPPAVPLTSVPTSTASRQRHGSDNGTRRAPLDRVVEHLEAERELQNRRTSADEHAREQQVRRPPSGEREHERAASVQSIRSTYSSASTATTKESAAIPARAPLQALPMLQEDEREVQHELEGLRLEKQERKKIDVVASQKARLVKQMAKIADEEGGRRGSGKEQEQVPSTRDRKEKEKEERLKEERKAREREVRERIVQAQEEHVAGAYQLEERVTGIKPIRHAASMSTTVAPTGYGLEIPAETLLAAFEARDTGMIFRDPADDEALPGPRSFIQSWLDYTHKYGMGYALSDGTIGIHFNDSTSLMRAPDEKHLEYTTSHNRGVAYVRKTYHVDDYPPELGNKIHLMNEFATFITDRLFTVESYTKLEMDRTMDLMFVQKYFRVKANTIFKLSHDVIQFNFSDHTKIILSSGGLRVTYIDKRKRLMSYTLSSIMAQAVSPSPDTTEAEAYLHSKLITKLKFCRDSLQAAVAQMQKKLAARAAEEHGSD